MEGLIIRPAKASDLRRIAELIGGDPGDEAAGLVGDRGLARKLNMAFVKAGGSMQGWEHSVMADLNGIAVGVI